jgi:tryptophan synthase beta subunit
MANPNEYGYYGEFGGAYIPEMLYPNVEELKERISSIVDLDFTLIICKEIYFYKTLIKLRNSF